MSKDLSEAPQTRLIRYRALLDRTAKHNGINDLDAVGQTVSDHVAAEYAAAEPTSAMREFVHGPATYLFAESPAHEPRTLLVVGRPQPPGAQRDTAYQRGYPLPHTYAGRTVDRGHFLPYSGGGLYGPNLYLQDRALNRGWSRDGRRYRRLERLAVSASNALMWVCPIYIDETAVPPRSM